MIYQHSVENLELSRSFLLTVYTRRNDPYGTYAQSIHSVQAVLRACQLLQSLTQLRTPKLTR